MDSRDMCETNRLKESVYPGRGIVIGQTPDAKHLVQIYWIMGRSPTSRNRVFVTEGEFVKTDLVDPTQEVDPLTLYYPMKHLDQYHIVSNGDQTDTVYDALLQRGSFEVALRTRTYEPDGPIFTPRISGLVDLGGHEPVYRLAILKPNGPDSEICIRHFFEYESPVAGLGHCMTTYEDDGNPPPRFVGEPFRVELKNDLDEIANFYWNLLHADNKVAMVVKLIDPETQMTALKIVNRY
ncbi:MAG: inosine monophosphate cyclohydrolase [bacterium]|nr:inosine monophosphate cyclohydrolase [bacterium]